MSYPNEDIYIDRGNKKSEEQDKTQNTLLLHNMTKVSVDLDQLKSITNEERTAYLADRLEMISEEHSEVVEVKKKPRCIFRGHNGYRLKWELFILILAIWNGFSIPFNVAFYDPGDTTKFWTITNIITD